MNSTNSDDVIKSLLNVLKCLTNVLDKVLEMVLTFLPRLIILKKRVEKWFIKLVSALVTIVNYLILPRMPIQYLRWNTTSNMRLSSIRPSRGYLFCQKDSKRTCCLLCWWKGPKMTPPFLIFFFFFEFKPTIIYSCTVMNESENVGKTLNSLGNTSYARSMFFESALSTY